MDQQLTSVLRFGITVDGVDMFMYFYSSHFVPLLDSFR